MKRIFSLGIGIFIASIQTLSAQTLEGVNPEDMIVPTAGASLPEVKTIQLSTNVTLEYAEQGNPDGQPVILLHGYTDSRHSFDMVLPHLPNSMHVYAVTMRGHGNSSKPSTGYHPVDFARDVAAFIKTLAIHDPVIVGHSMGSTIAQSLAVHHPELIRALVLAGSFAKYDIQEVLDFKKVIDMLHDPVDSLFAAGFQTSTAVRVVPANTMRMFIEETLKLPAFVWKGVAAGWSTSSFLPKLINFTKPVLLIWGDKDSYCSRSHQELLLLAMKNAELRIYRGTGHALHWEEPERFAKDLADFITALP